MQDGGGNKRGNLSKQRLPRFVSPSTEHLLANKAPQRQLVAVESSNSEHERIRGSELLRLRAAMQAEDPLCAQCRREGRVCAWDELDHIVPLREGGTNERSNLQGLCYDCHRVKSAEESRRASRNFPQNSANLQSEQGGGNSAQHSKRFKNALPHLSMRIKGVHGDYEICDGGGTL